MYLFECRKTNKQSHGHHQTLNFWMQYYNKLIKSFLFVKLENMLYALSQKETNPIKYQFILTDTETIIVGKKDEQNLLL
jgi:hypothetical protein